MSRRKRVISLQPKVGDVSPGEYDWRTQFGGLDAIDGYAPMDAGKVRGIATALADALKALEAIANIPLSEFLPRKPDDVLMGWNKHKLYVRDVHAARELIARCKEV